MIWVRFHQIQVLGYDANPSKIRPMGCQIALTSYLIWHVIGWIFRILRHILKPKFGEARLWSCMTMFTVFPKLIMILFRQRSPFPALYCHCVEHNSYDVRWSYRIISKGDLKRHPPKISGTESFTWQWRGAPCVLAYTGSRWVWYVVLSSPFVLRCLLLDTK